MKHLRLVLIVALIGLLLVSLIVFESASFHVPPAEHFDHRSSRGAPPTSSAAESRLSSSSSLSSESSAPSHQSKNHDDDVHGGGGSSDPRVPVFDVDADPRCAARSTRWTLVVGIPTVDLDRGHERRKLQRATWMKYSAVASPAGVPPCSATQQQQQQEREGEGEEEAGRGARILTRFLLGLHPQNQYSISSGLKQEAAEEKDVIVLNMREGRVSTAKTPGGAGYWGLESEVGMSRKAYLWYVLASRYDADFVAKADDDLFLRANIVAAILRGVAATMHPPLHHSRKQQQRVLSCGGSFETPYVYWGRTMKWGAKKNDPTSKFPFVGGMSVIMSRALALWVRDSKIAAVNNMEPYHGDKPRYKQTNHDHEDVMVGRWIYNAKLPVCVVSDCRFHDVHVGANKAPVRPNSIGLHHLRVDEYSSFMDKYSDDVVSSKASLASVCGYLGHALRRIVNATSVARQQESRVVSLC